MKQTGGRFLLLLIGRMRCDGQKITHSAGQMQGKKRRCGRRTAGMAE